MTDPSALRVAVIGAGPAGFYAAEHLLKQTDFTVAVDLFDRLPTPFGLVRHGVAPDHLKIKNVTKVFDKTAAHPRFRFFGHVELGRHVSVEDLRRHYHAILYAVGAQSDRALDIPGEDLPGSHSATAFVAWYNGHPDYRDLTFDLSCEQAVIVGMGNVAVDVARILCRSADELRHTDIAEHALEALSSSRIRRVVVLGRRGPAQAACSHAELKELVHLESAQCRTVAAEVALDEWTRRDLAANPDAVAEQKIKLLQEIARDEDPARRRVLTIRLLVSPVRILEKNGRVGGVTIVRNQLQPGSDGSLRPCPTDVTETLDCGLIFRSVGYLGVPLPGVPFDARRGVIPNAMGRVLRDGATVRGEYCAGWIKRGPSGLIGTNKADACETADGLLADARDGLLCAPAAEDPQPFIRGRQPDYFTFDQWRRLDEREVAAGLAAGRPRVKFTTIRQMLDARA